MLQTLQASRTVTVSELTIDLVEVDTAIGMVLRTLVSAREKGRVVTPTQLDRVRFQLIGAREGVNRVRTRLLHRNVVKEQVS